MKSTYSPAEAASLFHRLTAPWWVAGGWALDLHLGAWTREHEDLDIAILRRDLDDVRDALPAWRFHVGHGEGVIEPAPLGDAPMPVDKHAVWCRPRDDAPWAFELLLNEAEGDLWRFRRDARVTRPLATLGSMRAGIPYLAPEIVLLHKAKARRAVDEADFARTLPSMAPAALAWLRDALALAHPEHPWIAEVSMRIGEAATTRNPPGAKPDGHGRD